jgi:hypothetical protein
MWLNGLRIRDGSIGARPRVAKSSMRRDSLSLSSAKSI